MNDVAKAPASFGFALIVVLVLLVAASGLLLAAAQEFRCAQRAQSTRARQRWTTEAREFCEAALVTRLRAELAGDSWPPKALLCDAEDSAAGIRFAGEYPPAELKPYGFEAAALALHVKGYVLPRALPLRVRTIARDPADGRPQTVVRDSLSIRETALSALEAAIEAQLRAVPEAGPPLSPTAATSAANWLARILQELAGDPALARDLPSLGTELRARLATTSPIGPDWVAPLESRLDALLAVVDPAARLRRTNAHPARVDGKDRGHFAAPGATLSSWPSGEYRLRVEVEPAQAEQGWRTSPPPPKSSERSVEVCRITRLAAEDEATTATILQPGGVEIGRALQGPEDLGDLRYEIGAAFEIDVTAAAPLFEPESWRALPCGLLAIAPSHAGGSPMARIVINVVLRAGASSVAFEPLPTVDEPVRFIIPRVTGGLVVAGTHTLWFQSTSDAESRVPLESPLLGVHSIGGKILAVLADEQLRLFHESGDAIASKHVSGLRGAGVLLPFAEAVLFPPLDPADSWTLVDAALEPRAVVGPTPGPLASELYPDGRGGLWWTERADVTRVVHADVRGDSLVVATFEVAAEASGIALPLVRSAAFANRGLFALVGSDARALLVRRTGDALDACGLLSLPALPDALLADSGDLALWIERAGRLWCVTLAAEQVKHPALGWQLALAPRPLAGASRDFQAPLVGDFRAALAGGELCMADGTCNHGGSVLRAPDLADLFVDGLYVSPLRGEHLRYEWNVVNETLGAGAGEMWVKPERAASAEPEPSEPRTLVALRQQGSLRFTPDAEWVRRFHPAAPAQLHSFTVFGAPTRPLVATSAIERRPLDAVWCHRRSIELASTPWRIEAWAGSPPSRLADWTIDQVVPGATLSSAAYVPDVTEGGEWAQFNWSWSYGGRAALTVDGASDLASAALPSEPPEFASEFTSAFDSAELELGGAASGRSFRGTLRALAIDWSDESAAPSGDATYSPTTDFPHLRLVAGPYAPGTRLVAVQASGAFPSGTSLAWRLTEVGPSRVQTSIGNGLTMRLADSVPLAELFAGGSSAAPDSRAPTTWIIALWLVPNAAGTAAPLVEELRAVLLPALDEEDYP